MCGIGRNTCRRAFITPFSRTHKIHICKPLNDPPTREICSISCGPTLKKGLFMKTPPVPLRNREMCRKISIQASKSVWLRRLHSYLPIKFRSKVALLLLYSVLNFSSKVQMSLCWRFDHLWSFLGNLQLWFVFCLVSGGKGEWARPIMLSVDTTTKPCMSSM